jgi:hypothetical protein
MNPEELFPAEVARFGDQLLRQGVATPPHQLMVQISTALGSLYLQHRGISKEIAAQIHKCVKCGCEDCQNSYPDLINKFASWQRDGERIMSVVKLLDGFPCEYPLPSKRHCERWLDQAQMDRVADQVEKAMNDED